MHKHIAIILIALAAGASGCMNKAEAQTPTGPTRMLTAETDANQRVAGTLIGAPEVMNAPSPVQYGKVLDGPMFLTDAFPHAAVTLYALASGQDCTLPSSQAVYVLDGSNGRIVATLASSAEHGLRLFIAANEELCASWTANDATSGLALTWSGFKPY